MREVPPAMPGVQEEVFQEPRPEASFPWQTGNGGAQLGAPTSVCMGKVTRGSEEEKENLKVTGSRRWGLGGSEEGWGPGTGAGGKEQAHHLGNFETPPPPKK